VPKLSVRRRTVAMTVAAALVGVSTAVLLPALTPAPAARAAIAPGATVRASVADGEAAAESDLGGYQQELAAGGNSVVFTSDSKLDNLATSPDGSEHSNENVYVRDLTTNRTVMISRGQFYWPEPEIGAHAAVPAPAPVMREVPPDQDSYQPTISADGRYVAFVTAATNIVRNDDDNDQDIIVCDRDPDNDGTFDENRENGDRHYEYFLVTTPRTSGDSDFRYDNPRWPRLSDDASRIVWQDQEYDDGYLRDRARTATLRRTPEHPPGPPVTVGWVDTPLGQEQLEDQAFADVSGDGRFIVLSAGFRLPTSDPYDNEVRHTAVMRVDTEAESDAVRRVDVDNGGKPIGVDEGMVLSLPAISRDGSVIAFQAERYFSYPCDGTCWDRGGQPDVYAVRLGQDGKIENSAVVSRDNVGDQVNGIAPGLSGDGRFLSFVTDNLNAHDGVDDVDGESCLYQEDSEDPTPGATPDATPDATPGAAPPQEGPRTIRTSCQVVVRDLVADRERAAAKATRLPGALGSPGTDDCVDPMPQGALCGGNASTTPFETERSPSLSSDGRRIAYESDATDLVPDKPDTNEVQDVFVRTFRPELRADPDPLDFGEVLIDTPTTATVRLDHVGIGPLVVSDLTLDGDAFTVLDQTCVNEGSQLQQAGNCLVEVEFLPDAESDFAGVLRLVLTDDREFTVDLVGTGVPEEPEVPETAAFSAGPDPLNFGSRLIRSTGPDKTVTVTNTGGTAMSVDTVTVEPPAARQHYKVTGNTCAGAPLAPDKSCVVTVRLIPAASGDLPAVLSFVDNAPGSPHLVGMAGSAPAPEIVVSPAVTPPNRVVTVTGTGFAPNRQVLASAPLAIQTNPVTVAVDGTFRAALLVLPKAAIGNRTVVAKVTVFPEINAEKPLLVVTPTVGPAEFVVRG
jgi:WD40-like Beta Propeller Repeat